MAYLGNAPARSFISFERQVFTIVNSQTAYTLDHSVNNENDLRLVINNIVQEPGSGKAYTASGTTLTLSAALTNGTDEMYCVFLGRATATNAPAAGSVNTAAITDLNVTTAKIAADAITEAKIADAAVESEHLNNNIISGQTALGATPADTDEFLVSDAGTIKRVDYSYIKGGTNTPYFEAYLSSSQTGISNGTWTKVQLDTELQDSGNCFDSSTNYRFTPNVAGKYYFIGSIYVPNNGNTTISMAGIYLNGSRYNISDRTFLAAHRTDYSSSVVFSTSTATISTIITMNGSSDYVELYGLHQATSGTIGFNDEGTLFRGFKIAE